MDATRAFLLLFCLLAFATVASAQPGRSRDALGEKIRRFAPADLSGNLSALSANDRKALSKLVQAAQLMDSIYLAQAWSGNLETLHRLESDDSPAGSDLLHYFTLNMGPWSKLDRDAPFIDGAPNPKPPGANLYPEDITKQEFDSWQKSLPEDEQTRANGFFYTVRRDDAGHLFTRPYSEEYRQYLEPAAQLLKEAALLTENASLKTFLILRADAFLTNDYYQSDLAWMDLDSPIEPTIGPYEVYIDEINNYKAAFEAFITVRDDEETGKLTKFSSYLQDIENNLPIENRYRNPSLGALSPIRVVDEIAVGGEARSGVQTAAFNLPNDERVTREKGSKRTLLKNVQEAKFRKILIPIAYSVLDPKQGALVAFEPFFTHILAHELMHGLGPHTINLHGRETTVRQEMREIGSALEEAKADISGLFALQHLIDKGALETSFEQPMYVTYLAGLFRSIRFGTNDAHGLGSAMQFNYLTQLGGFAYDEESKTFSVDFEKIKPAVAKLTGEIMTIQAEGNYAEGKELLQNYGTVKPETETILEKAGDIPVDIEPHFQPVE